MRMTASVGTSIFGSGRSSTRTSPGACSTAPRMVLPLGQSGRASVGAEDLLGHGHRGEGLGPAGVEGEMRDRLDELLLGHAVVLRVLQVEGELLGVPTGCQRGDGDQAAVAS